MVPLAQPRCDQAYTGIKSGFIVTVLTCAGIPRYYLCCRTDVGYTIACVSAISGFNRREDWGIPRLHPHPYVASASAILKATNGLQTID